MVIKIICFLQSKKRDSNLLLSKFLPICLSLDEIASSTSPFSTALRKNDTYMATGGSQPPDGEKHLPDNVI